MTDRPMMKARCICEDGNRYFIFEDYPLSAFNGMSIEEVNAMHDLAIARAWAEHIGRHPPEH